MQKEWDSDGVAKLLEANQAQARCPYKSRSNSVWAMRAHAESPERNHSGSHDGPSPLIMNDQTDIFRQSALSLTSLATVLLL
jgi:hypothetical protein